MEQEDAMPEEDRMIAACGLVCDDCEIMKATDDEGLATRIAQWFKRELNEEVDPEQIMCAGCTGDRDLHWSPDCWILLCCVDQKRLDFCYECSEFPCAKLQEWAKENEGYGEALERLHAMKG
jgi:hypothetical protein